MAPRTVTATATFATEVDGQERIVYAGTKYDATDPIVKGREAHFEADDPEPKPRRRRTKA